MEQSYLVPTGYQKLDTGLGGGLLSGKVTALSSLNDSDSTQFALSVALLNRQELPIAYFTWHDTKEKLKNRLVSMDAVVRFEEVDRQQISTEANLMRVLEARRQFSQSGIILDDSMYPDQIEKLKEDCLTFARRNANKALVIIDSIDSLTSFKEDSRTIIRQFNELAAEQNISILLLSNVSHKRHDRVNQSNEDLNEDILDIGFIRKDVPVCLTITDDFFKPYTSDHHESKNIDVILSGTHKYRVIYQKDINTGLFCEDITKNVEEINLLYDPDPISRAKEFRSNEPRNIESILKSAINTSVESRDPF